MSIAENNKVKLRADSRIRHKKILESARKLFLKNGYKGTSMNELVALAGGSKASIYSYFSNKEGLFLAVIDDMMQDLLAPLDTLPKDSKHLAQRLKTMADHNLEVLTSARGIDMARFVYMESSRYPQVGEMYFQNGPQRAINQLAEFLEEENTLGAIRIENPLAASRFFWGMLLHTPMLEGLCGVKQPMNDAQRAEYADTVTDEFMQRFSKD